jgi:hypothetical protein
MTTQALRAEWTTSDKIEAAFFGIVIALVLPALLIVAAQ